MRLKETLGNSVYTGVPYLFLCLFFNDLPGMFHSKWTRIKLLDSGYMDIIFARCLLGLGSGRRRISESFLVSLTALSLVCYGSENVWESVEGK